MMIRFLKGDSFHDRPLASYSSWHLPEDPVYEGPTVDEMRQSKVSMTATLSLAEGFGGTLSRGMIMTVGCIVIALLVVTAFVLGMKVGRKSAGRVVDSTMCLTERSLLKVDDNYGSI
jgi:hypothetical protein